MSADGVISTSACAVVNVAVGGYHGAPGNYYPIAQARLRRSLRDTGYAGALAFWTGGYPDGSPSHAAVPYFFTTFAMRQAEHAGAHTLLWLDAPFVAIKSARVVMEQLERDGYLLWSHPAGKWKIGHWASDEALAAFDVSRDAACELESLCGGAFGWSTTHPVGRALRDAYLGASIEAFRRQPMPCDPRIKGQRFSQVVLSLVAHRLGLRGSPTPAPFAWEDWKASEGTVFVHDPLARRLPWGRRDDA